MFKSIAVKCWSAEEQDLPWISNIEKALDGHDIENIVKGKNKNSTSKFGEVQSKVVW